MPRADWRQAEGLLTDLQPPDDVEIPLRRDSLEIIKNGRIFDAVEIVTKDWALENKTAVCAELMTPSS
jgi:hypothetical protein